jgi:hypothetical protein
MLLGYKDFKKRSYYNKAMDIETHILVVVNILVKLFISIIIK